MLAIRTPTGETFPGKITIIPSQKRWIFHCIYQYAFLHLYGTDTCSRNRLVLCDEDESEYGPFEIQILISCTNTAIQKRNFPFTFQEITKKPSTV